MKCLKCGKDIADLSKFCGYCGNPIEEIKKNVKSTENSINSNIGDSNETISSKFDKDEQIIPNLAVKIDSNNDELKEDNNHDSARMEHKKLKDEVNKTDEGSINNNSNGLIFIICGITIVIVGIILFIFSLL